MGDRVVLTIPAEPRFRSVATLVEVAARHQLLKARGYHPARELTERLAERRGTPEPESGR